MQIRFVESSNHFYHILVSSGPKGKKTFMQIHIPDIDIDIGLMSNWCDVSTRGWNYKTFYELVINYSLFVAHIL